MPLNTSDLKSINKIIHQMNMATNYKDGLSRVVKSLCALFKVKKCSLMVLNEKKELQIHAAVGLNSKIIKKVRIKPGEGIAGKILLHGKPVLVKNIEKAKEFKKKNEKKYNTASFLAAPLKYNGKVIGVVNLNNKANKKPFSEKDLVLLEPLLIHIGVVVKNNQLLNQLKGTNQTLGRKVAMMTTLFELTQDVIKKGDIFELLNSLILKISTILKGDSSSLMLYNFQSERLEIKAQVGLSQKALNYQKIQKQSESVSHWVFSKEKSILLVGKFKEYPQFNKVRDESQIKSALSVPLSIGQTRGTVKSSIHSPVKHKRTTIGVINVNRRPGQADFNQDDLDFLSILSYQIALAVENANFVVKERKYVKEINITKGQLEVAIQKVNEEIDMASRVQKAILPKTLGRIPGLKIATFYQPSSVLGGDLFDVIQLGSRKIALLMIDVSGHGVAASLVTALAKVTFHAYLRESHSPLEIFKGVNKEIFTQLPEERYLTAFLAIIDLEKMEMIFANAAHLPQYLIKKDGSWEKLIVKNFGIGLLEDWDFKENKVPLKRGDKIVTFTDGLVECFKPNGDRHGVTEVEAIWLEKKQYEPQQIVDKMVGDQKEFLEGSPPEDDVAILVAEIE